MSSRGVIASQHSAIEKYPNQDFPCGAGKDNQFRAVSTAILMYEIFASTITGCEIGNIIPARSIVMRLSSNVLYVDTRASIRDALNFRLSEGGGETLPVVNLRTASRATLFLPNATYSRWKEKGVIEKQASQRREGQLIEMVKPLPDDQAKLYNALQYGGFEIPISYMAVGDKYGKGLLIHWETPENRRGYELYPTDAILQDHRLWVLYNRCFEDPAKTTPEGGFFLNEHLAHFWLAP